MKSVCVFCGSGFGKRQAYTKAAAELGRLFACLGIRLVYGGSSVGLMGVIADACLEAGGEVVGVIPRSMVDREIAHTGLADLRVVLSMHERKALMAELSDAFIAMPGGFGTFDELFEILTWRQIGIHEKPVGLLNVESYFEPLLAMADHAVGEGFLRAPHRRNLLVETDAARLLAKLEGCQEPVVP
jgi:uncharacterized protein (TIGR00730 family)